MSSQWKSFIFLLHNNEEIFQAIYYVYYMTKGKSKIVTLSSVIGIIL
jgi:hypothetical protein